MSSINDELEALHETICIMVAARGYSLKNVFSDSGLSRAYFYKFIDSKCWNPTMTTLGRMLVSLNYTLFDFISFRTGLYGDDLMHIPNSEPVAVIASISRIDLYRYIREYHPNEKCKRFESIFHNKDDGTSDIYYSTIVEVAMKLHMKISSLFECVYSLCLQRKSYEKQF